MDIPTRILGTPIIRMGAVTSTMDIARRLELIGAPEGAAVIAATQSFGRGRSNRIWQSPPGSGLYLSILLRPNLPIDDFQPFSVAIGLSICEALDPNHTIGLQLKWPNDVVYKGRKMAGILVTTTVQGQSVASSIVGIGLNLRTDPIHPEASIALDEIPNIASPLDPRPEFRILTALNARYTQLIAGAASAIADWPSRVAFLGEHVTVQDEEVELSGILHSLDAQGSLLLCTPGGLRAITSGELARGPRLTR